jgi:hypothetical protein
MNEHAKKWVAELRSGKWKQSQKVLTELDGTGNLVGCCCLGVACELFNQENPDILRIAEDVPDNGSYTPRRTYDDQSGLPPRRVMNWLGLKDRNGTFGPNGEKSLTGENDAGGSFELIADLIEQHEEELFFNEA